MPCWTSTGTSMDVFLDTNILMDVLTDRHPWYVCSARVWAMVEQGRVRGLISVISFNNVYYIVRRLRDRRTADLAMTILRDLFVPVALDKSILDQAIDARTADFEDAIQYFSAMQAGAGCLVTRNPRHFPGKDLPVLTPEEFLATVE